MTEVDTQKPLVTFALFSYNQERYIRDAILGAFSQTYEPLEIIISDDCSSDGTYSIIQTLVKEYEGRHSIITRKSESNLGFAAHMNEAFALVTGSYITLGAGDDIAEPNRTSELMKIVLSSEDVSCAHSGVFEIDLEGVVVRKRNHPKHVRNISKSSVIETGRGIVSQSCCFRKEIIDRFPPFDPSLTYEAPALALRASVFGQVIYTDAALTRYRVGSGVSTKPKSSFVERYLYIPRKGSRWNRTSYRQLVLDLEEVSGHESEKKDASDKALYWANIDDLNNSRNIFFSTYANVRRDPFDLRTWISVCRSLLFYPLAWLTRAEGKRARN